MAHDKIKSVRSLKYYTILFGWFTVVIGFIKILGKRLSFYESRIRKNFLPNQGLDFSELTWFSAFRLKQDELKQESAFEVIDNNEPKLQYKGPQLQTDRKKLWLRKSKAPLLDLHDDTIGIVDTNEELTAAKLELQKYSIILNNSHDGFWVNDLTGKFIEVNNAFCKMIGYTREELLQMSVNDIEIIGNFENARRNIEEIIENGSDTFEAKYKRKDSRIIDGSVTINYHREISADQMFVFLRDITELKRDAEIIRDSEEKLTILNEELIRSNKELEEFAFVASHDLQEPLRMVASYTQLLEKRYKDKLDKDAKDFIHFSVDGANRMQQLLNHLLEYSRITTRGKQLKEIDLSSVLGLSISNLQNKIEETKTLITKDNLPIVLGDEIQLSRVFQNLIDNAIKFKGIEAPRIHISSRQEGNKVVVSIKDNGIGIERKYFDRIFTVFQRLHSVEEYPGAGIGLAICKRIIEKHNGKIWIDSEPGKGAIFYFTLNK